MKTTNTLLLSLTLMLSANAFSQANDFDVFASDSLPTCSNGISVFITAGSLPETNGTIHVEWGDGVTEQVTFATTQQSPQQSYYSGFLQHTYATPGYYTGNVKVWSAISSSFVGNTQNFMLLAGDQNACGFASVYVSSPMQSGVLIGDVPVDFTDASGNTLTITAANYNFGYYHGLDPSETYSMSINDAWLSSHNYVQISPDYQITSFNTQGYAGHYSFEVSCGSNLVNADIGVMSLHGAFVAPLESGHLMISVCNSSCSAPENAEVAVTFESFLVPDIANAGLQNPSVSGNVLTFDLSGLSGCEWIDIPFTLPGTVTAGTPVNISVTATGASGQDLDPSNNTMTYVTEVLNSYDPNNKLVDKGQYISHEQKEKLQYVINFQNEGNFPALNVVVKDTISAYLDLATFRLIRTSHGASYSIDQSSRVVTFSFPMIDLRPVSENEEASKGYIVYAIDELDGLPLSSEIKNTAYIYFDFNPPIITNTTSNINSMLAVDKIEAEAVNIYPNPASGKITVDARNITHVRVLDYTGKVVMQKAASEMLDVSYLPEGLYLVEISTEHGNMQQKLVVKH